MNRTMQRNSKSAIARDYLSIRDAAERLGVDYKVVYRLVRDEKLPYTRIGWQYRIPPEALDDYLASRSRGHSLKATQSPTRSEKAPESNGHRLRTKQAVTRESARKLEAELVDRFRKEIAKVVEVRHPLKDTPEEIRHWEEYEKIVEDRKGIMDALNVAFLDQVTLDTTPHNTRIYYRVPLEPPLILELRFLSRLSRLCKKGMDDEPLHLEELQEILAEIGADETGEDSHAFYVVGLASPTGWDTQAVNYIEEMAPEDAPYPNRVVFLLDLRHGTLHYSERDERAVQWSMLFERVLGMHEAVPI